MAKKVAKKTNPKVPKRKLTTKKKAAVKKKTAVKKSKPVEQAPEDQLEEFTSMDSEPGDDLGFDEGEAPFDESDLDMDIEEPEFEDNETQA